MLRLKRQSDIEEKSKVAKKSKMTEIISEDEDSSSDEDDVQILEEQRPTGPLWHDSDDSDEEENAEKITQKMEQKIGPIPHHLSKHATAHADSDSDSDVEPPTDVVEARAGPLHTTEKGLPADSLRFKRLRDANADAPARATVTAVRFHPWSPVVMVGSSDRSLSLFHVDGDKNERLACHYFEKFPVKCARFTPDGRKAVIAGVRKSIRVLDMQTEAVTVVHSIRGVEKPIQKFEVSPDGKFVVLIGNYGVLHVIDTKSMEQVGKMEANGLVMSLVFASDDILYAFSDDGRVYRFSLTSRRLVGSFSDDGCVGGRAMAVSGDGRFLACGHSTGVVNIYRHADTHRRSQGPGYAAPQPIKSCDNLLTSCDLLRFTPGAELLLMASSADAHAVRALHMASGRVFSNFPGRTDRLAKVTDLDVSPNSGFCVLGQSDGRVALMRLLHFPQL